MKNFINQRKTLTHLALTAAAFLGLGAIQAQAQSVTYNFTGGSNQGWSNAGFGNTPAATTALIGGQEYLYLPFVNFQNGSDASDSSGNLSGFNAAMSAAINNPSGYDISYNYYLNTSTFSNATFLQLGVYVNTGTGYYKQDYSTPNQISFNGAQVSSGDIFTGTVTENLGTMGVADGNAATEGYFRLGLIENTGSGTAGVGVYYTDISVYAVPEPATLAMAGLGGLSMLFLRRRKA